MPIYEFYCPDCNVLFNFFSRTVKPDARPECPKCGRPRLEKQVSLFATAGRGEEEGEGDEDMPISEQKMESAMESLVQEAEGLSEDDPRQEARLMRRFSEMTGIQYSKGMQEALSRLEAGEDMERVEEEMGDLLDGEEEPFVVPDQAAGAGKRGAKPPPARDETLYEM